jgi:hypothetical protein
MITITISHPNGRQQDVLLSGVPRAGESVLLQNGNSPKLIVEHVVWIEGGNGGASPTVLVEVRHRDE